MAYKYIDSPIDKSLYPIKSPYTMKAETLTVHNTYNDASARNEAAYMKSNKNQTSFHTAIDDIEVIGLIPFSRNAWAAGDGANGKGNRASIHMEICYSKSGGPKYVAAEENAVQYIAGTLKMLGWGVDRLRQHFDWSKKNCPHRIRDEKRWNSFVNRIQVALNKLNEPANKPVASTPVAKVEEKNTGSVKVLVDSLNYYDGPRWSKPTGVVKKNQVFTVADKIKVDGAWQYKLKSGTYITASDKYVKFTAK